jgi:hypothetical protein
LRTPGDGQIYSKGLEVQILPSSCLRFAAWSATLFILENGSRSEPMVCGGRAIPNWKFFTMGLIVTNAPPDPDTGIHSVEAGIQGHGLDTIMIPTGPLPPAGNGEPPTGESVPVVMLTENAEMSLSTLFATYKNPPFGSSATPKGC